MSASPSPTAARIDRPSVDHDTRRAMKVARSPKSVTCFEPAVVGGDRPQIGGESVGERQGEPLAVGGKRGIHDLPGNRATRFGNFARTRTDRCRSAPRRSRTPAARPTSARSTTKYIVRPCTPITLRGQLRPHRLRAPPPATAIRLIGVEGRSQRSRATCRRPTMRDPGPSDTTWPELAAVRPDEPDAELEADSSLSRTRTRSTGRLATRSGHRSPRRDRLRA